MVLSDGRLRVLEAAATAERNAGPGNAGSGTGRTGVVGMANELGLTGTEVRAHLEAMEEAGLVEPGNFGPELTDRGRTVLEEGPGVVESPEPSRKEGGGGSENGDGLLPRLLS